MCKARGMGSTVRASLRRAIVSRADALAIRRYRVLSGRTVRSEAVDRATLRAFKQLVAAQAPPGPIDRTVVDAFRPLAKADLAGSRPSPKARKALVNQFHRLYYHTPARTWQNTYFLGVPVWKNPLDMWLYQEMIHDVRPDVLVEAGTKYGGSAFYFARIFDLMEHGHVVTIDVEPQPDRPEHRRITYLTGSSTDPAIARRVDEI